MFVTDGWNELLLITFIIVLLYCIVFIIILSFVTEYWVFEVLLLLHII